MTNILHAASASTVVMAATAAGQLIEQHEVNLQTVCSVGALVVIGVWRLSRQFQKIDDRLQSLETKTGNLACMRSNVCPSTETTKNE